jgi:hypothetical protein
LFKPNFSLPCGLECHVIEIKQFSCGPKSGMHISSNWLRVFFVMEFVWSPQSQLFLSGAFAALALPVNPACR